LTLDQSKPLFNGSVRSAVFFVILFGDFVEAKQTIVELGYSTEGLEAVVQYIYTDAADILGLEKKASDESFVRTMLSLIGAAAYFGLPELCKKATYFASSSIKNNTVVWFAACGSLGALALADSALEESALEHIRANPKKLLEGEAIALLIESQVEKVLKDEKLEADEYTLFRILQAWGSAHEEKDGGGQDATAADVPTSRKRTAEHMSKYISLERISPVDIYTTVVF
jgi:hypothetical protein